MAGPPLTLIWLDPIGITPYSARGLTQELKPIQLAAAFRRTINGVLTNTSPAQFQKYDTIITGSDIDPPPLDGVFLGAQINVSCISELSFLTGGSPARPVVVGSTREADGYTFYRPLLAMTVTNFDVTTDEWSKKVDWTLELEETGP